MRTVDAFTDRPFTGNPAAVVLLDETPTDAWMTAVARETNVPDRAFVVRERSAEAEYRLRWFKSVLFVQAQLGHADVRTTQRYAHADHQAHRAGAARVAAFRNQVAGAAR